MCLEGGVLEIVLKGRKGWGQMIHLGEGFACGGLGVGGNYVN